MILMMTFWKTSVQPSRPKRCNFGYLCRMTVDEIKAYFEGIALPERIQIDAGVVIEDIPLFLRSHIYYLEVNAGKKSAEVYLERVQKLIKALESRSDD